MLSILFICFLLDEVRRCQSLRVIFLLLTWVWQRRNETDVGDVDQLVMVEFLTGKLFQFDKVDARRAVVKVTGAHAV